MRSKLAALESEGERLLSGAKLDWGSAKDIGRVLFDELRLGESDMKRFRRRRPPTAGEKRGGKKKRVQACVWDTSSNSLRLLIGEHPLPAMIIEVRRRAPFKRS